MKWYTISKNEFIVKNMITNQDLPIKYQYQIQGLITETSEHIFTYVVSTCARRFLIYQSNKIYLQSSNKQLLDITLLHPVILGFPRWRVDRIEQNYNKVKIQGQLTSSGWSAQGLCSTNYKFPIRKCTFVLINIFLDVKNTRNISFEKLWFQSTSDRIKYNVFIYTYGDFCVYKIDKKIRND